MANEQKTPFSRTQPLLAQRAALAEIAKRGSGLPGKVVSASGPIITAALDVSNALLQSVQMPLFGPEYIRYPIQPGDLGIAIAIPVYIGAVSGLGPDIPAQIGPLTANLSALVWLPCGNQNWTASPNPNAIVVYGPEGVILQDKAGSSPDFSVTVNSSGITFQGAGHTVVLNSSGLTIDGVLFSTHAHASGTLFAGSTPVTGNTGAVSS